MLWDSILRGFPVGSFVICDKFLGQAARSGRHGSGWPEEAVTHFLLDGQQCANAIALAFRDALAPEPGGRDPVAALWIDLAPDFPRSSTRRFAVRMLTVAHPGGFGPEDQAPFLGVAAIREAVERYRGMRPRLIDAWPHQSACPVPFQWLLQAAAQATDEASFWRAVLDRCRNGEDDRSWRRAVIELLATHLDGSLPSPALEEIEAESFKGQVICLPSD